MMAISYEIRKVGYGFELVSVVETSFGGSAVNFVCGGSREYCEGIKRKLEAMK